MRFLITGDLVVNQEYDPEKNIDLQLVKLFESSDFNIVNLEAPVTQSENKIIKTGPHLKANKNSTLETLKKLNINIVALANNHIKDYGEKGVMDTIDFCSNNDVKAIGAGRNSKEAAQTTILETPEGKIALINIAENEWASAGEESAGSNGMNLIKDIKIIQKAKKDNDFVFVIIHGGHEYYNLPSPRMQEQYRFYADQGADLVVGHHTHCISGYEVYNGTPIYYSLGNFLFTKNSNYSTWYTGIILEVHIINGKLSTNIHPIHQAKNTYKLELLQKGQKEKIIKNIEEYNSILSDKKELNRAWMDFINSKSEQYSNYWSPLSFIHFSYLKGLLRRLKIRLTNKKGLALYLNLMRCEAHSDISKEIINQKIK